jgi:hypothetical protein
MCTMTFVLENLSRYPSLGLVRHRGMGGNNGRSSKKQMRRGGDELIQKISDMQHCR